MTDMEITQCSEYLDCGDHQLHIRRIAPIDKSAIHGRVLMIHGSIENGRIFYNEKGRGLGCYLAKQGFDVLVPDLRGRGLSTPKIAKGQAHGQFELVSQDIPRLIEHAVDDDLPLTCVSHSLGGTLLIAAMLRNPELAKKIKGKVHFGVKRRIRVRTLERYLKINFFWNIVGPILGRFVGYLPAVALKMGADNEPLPHLKQVTRWFDEEAWLDLDGFDYHWANRDDALPNSWFIGSEADKSLGAAGDIKLFIDELNLTDVKYSHLSVENGNKHDYDHINVLTHKLAEGDHFVEVSQWLKHSNY